MTPISLIISTSLTPRVYLGWFFGIEKGCESLDSHPLFVAEREGCKPSLLTPYIVVVYIPLRFNCSQIVAIGEYFENTHSYCCEICSLAFLGFKGTNK